MTLKDILPWLIPTIITVVIAVINIIILVDQKKQTSAQICIDLMEKRVKLYYEVLSFIYHFNGSTIIDNNALILFEYNTRDVEFLFGDEIYKFLKEIVLVARDYVSVQERICEIKKNNQHDEKYKHLEKQQKGLADKLSAYITEDIVLNNFNRYLDFRDYKLPKKRGRMTK